MPLKLHLENAKSHYSSLLITGVGPTQVGRSERKQLNNKGIFTAESTDVRRPERVDSDEQAVD